MGYLTSTLTYDSAVYIFLKTFMGKMEKEQSIHQRAEVISFSPYLKNGLSLKEQPNRKEKNFFKSFMENEETPLLWGVRL
jgi:hypothetical protein